MAVGRILTGLVILGFLCAAPVAAHAQSSGSSQQAADFVRDASKRAVALVAEQDHAQLYDLIQQTFDFDAIGKFALGRSWQAATTEQRAEYQRAFLAATSQMYADRLAAEKGATLKVRGARPGAGPAEYLVAAEIRRGSGESMDIDLKVRDGATGMKIVDVLSEGVSMQITQRSDFAAVIRRQGVDGLISQLKARSTTMEASASAAR